MELSWSEEDPRFQDEVRAVLDAELTPELRRVGRWAGTNEIQRDIMAKAILGL